MKALIKLILGESHLSKGFHDYSVDEIAKAFHIGERMATLVLADYRALLRGTIPRFMGGINPADLRAISK